MADEALDATATPPRPTPLRRNRNFALLWVGQTLSEIGGGASSLAYPLLVLAVSHSATIAGVVGSIGLALGIVAQLPSGALADRLDRRNLMLGCDLIRGLAVLAVVIGVAVHHIAWPVIAVVAGVDAVTGTLFWTGSYSLVPMVVDESQLDRAWSSTQARHQAASLAGPPFGGALYGAARALPFAADAASYLVSVVTLGAMRGKFRAVSDEPRVPLHREVRDGIGYVRATPLLMAFVLGAPFVNFAYGGIELAVPLTLRVHGVSAGVIGLVVAAFSVGSLTGALMAPWLSRRLGLARLAIGLSLSGTLLFAAVAALVPSALAGIPLVATGMFAPALNTALLATMSRTVPRHLLARVTSTMQFAGSLLAVPAPVVAGALVAHASPHVAVGVFVASYAVALVIAVVNRRAWASAAAAAT